MQGQVIDIENPLRVQGQVIDIENPLRVQGAKKSVFLSV